MEVVNRKVDELISPDYNPRKISPKQREEIRRFLEAFGFVQPLVVNMNPDRLNIVVGGNQRLEIAKTMGFTEVPCVEVNLPEAEEKELNVRLNKNQAEFDFDALKEYFDRDMLLDVGFTEKEIGKQVAEFDKKFSAVTNDTCAFPIVPKFNEKYGCVIVTFNNELDETFLLNFLKLERAKDYKNTRLGVPYVIDVKDFQNIIADYAG